MTKNKFTTRIAVILLFATTAFASSCKEKDEDVAPVDKFITAFSSPSEGKIFSNGDTVNIKTQITNDTEMYGYEVKIINKSMGNTAVFSKKEEDLNIKTFNIDESWVNNVTHHSDMKVELTIYMDKNDNKREVTLNFHCHP